ncbi:MAG: hypothetical protein H7228_09710 [Polaromonas sp.]|nr:hypothetical protein [Polaromonas sp.]
MSTNSKYEHLASLPYVERQLVVVMPDEIVAAQRKAEDANSDKPIDWMGIAKNAGRLLLPSSGGLVGVAFVAATEAYAAWARARANGVNAIQIKRSEASNFTFPPAHPRDGVLYVAHPSDSNVYYTVASFHRVTFEHKFAEAVDLLMDLGATEIRVEHVRGWSSEFAATLSVPLQAGPVGAKAGVNCETETKLLFEASLPDNKSRTLPEKLVWYPHERTWQSLAKGRLSHGLTKFSLTVNYEDDFGINAGLKVGATKAGLELGGSFENHVATSWRLDGIFASEN